MSEDDELADRRPCGEVRRALLDALVMISKLLFIVMLHRPSKISREMKTMRDLSNPDKHSSQLFD